MQPRKQISTPSHAIKHLPLKPATPEVGEEEQLKSLLPYRNCIPCHNDYALFAKQNKKY